MPRDIEQRSVDALRMVSIDAVQRAEAGHPGAPMGMADFAAVLWSEFILLDPDDPTWQDRDRFVLSNGHGSMLLYSLLHLSGFGLAMDELEDFRQFGSRTAGHPEYEPGIGIETTTGPLGQGFATAVGMAIAESHLRAKLGEDLVNHRTYAFVSAGDLMEGVASAANGEERPSLVIAKTHIGYGSPNKQDSASAHGNPLGVDEVKLVREEYEWDYPPFVVPDEVYEWFRAGMERGRAARRAWEQRRDQAFAADTAVEERWDSYFDPGPVTLETPVFEGPVATRSASGAVIQELAAAMPGVIGGSADLTPSNNTQIDGSGDFSALHPEGRNLKFGVREHAMGAVVNGVNLHGGLRCYGGTFLIFSDYMRASVRLSALMGAPSIWIWTHDSVFLGEDGPTHQPIEHLAALRAMPNLWVVRPADPTEVAVGWEMAIGRTDGPTAMALTRQNLPVPAVEPDRALVRRGAYNQGRVNAVLGGICRPGR